MKKVLCLLMLLSLVLAAALPSLALEQDPDFYVTDETGSLSRDTREHVIEVNEQLEYACGGQIVVVFIDYFGDVYADEYAVGLFNDWSLSDMGMLLVVSPKEGRGGITVGRDLTDRFSEEDINKYLDRYFWDDFDDGKYDKAVTKLVDKLADWFEDEFDVKLGEVQNSSGGSGSSGSAGWLAGLGIIGAVLGFIFRNIFIILIFVIIIVAVIVSDRRRYRGYYMSMGMPMPPYRPWYMFSSRPYRSYRAPRPPRRPPPPPPSVEDAEGFPARPEDEKELIDEILRRIGDRTAEEHAVERFVKAPLREENEDEEQEEVDGDAAEDILPEGAVKRWHT